MFKGKLLAIGISKDRGSDIEVLQRAELAQNSGIVGDRYFKEGLEENYEAAITLIEQESLEGVLRDHGISISHNDSRRNLLTEGVPLNHLVGKQFQVGEAVLEGFELCEPCGTLERRTQKGVLKALLHRGGLRARIVKSGTIELNCEINSI